MMVVIVVVLVVACGDVVSLVPATGGPALLDWADWVLVVPVFPAGSVAFDAACTVEATVAPSTRNNMTTVNILSPHSNTNVPLISHKFTKY